MATYSIFVLWKQCLGVEQVLFIQNGEKLTERTRLYFFLSSGFFFIILLFLFLYFIFRFFLLVCGYGVTAESGLELLTHLQPTSEQFFQVIRTRIIYLMSCKCLYYDLCQLYFVF